jgi:CheY-like chemotaxis protein
LYIDDEKTKALGTAQGFLNEQLNLSVEVKSPTADMSILQDLSQYQGIILDLRLDLSGARTNIRGTAVAQEIRTRATENTIQNLPIILLSADPYLKSSYNKDSTSHDLFDFKLSKQELKDFADVQKQLVSYALAYLKLNQLSRKDGLQVFGLTDTENCYDHFLLYLNQYYSETPSHEWVRVVQEEIHNSGVLIDEVLLSTRLGVEKTSEDWNVVKKSLNEARYTGILSDYHQRWWMHLVENWWLKTLKMPFRLENGTAVERVNALKAKLELKNLKPLVKAPGSIDSEFWYACKATQVPLTASDGILLSEYKRQPWYEPNYISINACLKEIGKNKSWTTIASSEKDRIEKFKKRFGNEKRRK